MICLCRLHTMRIWKTLNYLPLHQYPHFVVKQLEGCCYHGVCEKERVHVIITEWIKSKIQSEQQPVAQLPCEVNFLIWLITQRYPSQPARCKPWSLDKPRGEEWRVQETWEMAARQYFWSNRHLLHSQKLLYSKGARGRGDVSGLLEFRPGDIPSW